MKMEKQPVDFNNKLGFHYVRSSSKDKVRDAFIKESGALYDSMLEDGSLAIVETSEGNDHVEFTARFVTIKQ